VAEIGRENFTQATLWNPSQRVPTSISERAQGAHLLTVAFDLRAHSYEEHLNAAHRSMEVFIAEEEVLFQ
jgi:hypothetical protein